VLSSVLSSESDDSDKNDDDDASCARLDSTGSRDPLISADKQFTETTNVRRARNGAIAIAIRAGSVPCQFASVITVAAAAGARNRLSAGLISTRDTPLSPHRHSPNSSTVSALLQPARVSFPLADPPPPRRRMRSERIEMHRPVSLPPPSVAPPPAARYRAGKRREGTRRAGDRSPRCILVSLTCSAYLQARSKRG
jgi:hypothetical protein